MTRYDRRDAKRRARRNRRNTGVARYAYFGGPARLNARKTGNSLFRRHMDRLAGTGNDGNSTKKGERQMLKQWTLADERAELRGRAKPPVAGNIMRITHFAAFNDFAIQGIGPTKAEALAQAEDGLEPGQTLEDLDLEVLPCTAALADEVEANGGAIGWGDWYSAEHGDFVVCTITEEEAMSS